MFENFETALAITLREEGGDRLTNVAGDAGRLTKWGISEAQYPNLDIANLTRNDAAKIYRRDYWAACHCDELPAGLDVGAFDFSVTSGPGTSMQTLQRSVGVRADGAFGPQTLTASREVDLVVALRRFADLRGQFYREIVRRNPTQAKFLEGWLDRAAGVALEALWLVAAAQVPGLKRRAKEIA